ncbi:MAG TPA: multicopper oxidase domain-containing protein [Thermoanaerobaculia bacterium]|nr:multicopper oxidase domain-containing protein [Thermoanaerobaculia bacterium]
MKKNSGVSLGAVAWAALLVLGGPSWGQPPCAETVKCVPIEAQDLWTIPTIEPKQGGVLSTELDVQMKSLCVPTTETSTGSGIWNTAAQCLRTYVYPGPDGKPAWGYKDPTTGNLMVFPGPTLRLRKGEAASEGKPAHKGDTLKLVLRNNLTASGGECNSACADSATSCPAGTCDSPNLTNLINACANTDNLPSNCCCIVDCTQKEPNCFHGNETTNLHFHGSHVSPQEHQDFILLELKPESSRPKEGAAAGPEHGAHGEYSQVVYGHYDYLIPEFGPNQPEGTHWYHPHKHGSTSIQILNGMAGALIITGGIDDYLKTLYGDKITEQLLVLQQIAPTVNLYSPTAKAPQTLVNGQVNPTITIKSGEIQRWRIINATMQQSAQVKTYFPAGLEYRQIAQDGITFSPVNLKCQPFYNFNPTQKFNPYNPADPTNPANQPAFSCTTNPSAPPAPVISPGNRVDFLVRVEAAKAPQAQKERKLTVRRQVVGGMGEEGRRKILLRDDALAPGPEEPALFTVVIDDGAAEKKQLRAAAADFPDWTKWPKPAYLSNITDAEVAANPPISIAWQQIVADSQPAMPWPYGVRAFTQFFINGKQFDSSCANVTTKLDTAAEWTISNATKLNHPFHIHTNPVQLVSFNGATLPPQGQAEPEPVWMDTIALPQAILNPNAAPKNLTTPIQITPVSLKLRQRYENFTGQYVLHCHFLGHEDRGMMFSVQTVCKDKPDFYGKADGTPECAGQLLPKIPTCK